MSRDNCVMYASWAASNTLASTIPEPWPFAWATRPRLTATGKYRGRGLIQITGHDNYLRCSQGLFGDARLLALPELLEQPQWATESAAWFWEQNGLNELADRDQFNSITRRINGGLNGLEERLQLWARARAVLCQPST